MSTATQANHMAPYLDEDFVLTISDNDHDIMVPDSRNWSISHLSPTITYKNLNRKRMRNSEWEPLVKNVDGQLHKPRSKRQRPLAGHPEQTDGTQLFDIQDRTPRSVADGGSDGSIEPDFEFLVGDMNSGVVEDFEGWGLEKFGQVQQNSDDKRGVDIDELIARRKDGVEGKSLKGTSIIGVGRNGDEEVVVPYSSRVKTDKEEDESLAEDGFGMGIRVGEEDSDDNGMLEETGTESDNESTAEPMSHPDDDEGSITSSVNDSEDPQEQARRLAFFAPEENGAQSKAASKIPGSFQSMSLSRSILRGLANVGFSEPTPIQCKAIPVALLGKDVVGGAVTGSGKTAAFIVPILERLLYRPRKTATSRVAILMPTRELAVQCFNVAKKLAVFTDVTFCQLIGGFSLREQEAILKTRPDVIIATPGRFIDHMRNSPSFTVDTLEILVLDEADRMLEDGFADELNEILATIPKSRQTMLFSATMTDSVDKLVRVGLNRPVRLMIDSTKQTVETLVQEFVRLRPGREGKRLACLLYLCEHVFTEKVIVFFRQKREAHRARITLGLCGLKVTELHGDMSQEQRLSSVESFRSSKTTHLLATDLASRGLDIRAVSTVVNYEPPQSHAIYLHRVGRTARAGLDGRACTLVAEPDRKLVREIVRTAKSQGARVVSRVLDIEAIDDCEARLKALNGEIEVVMSMDKEEKALGEAERDVRRGENLVEFSKEIAGRPKRTWFLAEEDKRKSHEKGAKELNGDQVAMKRKGDNIGRLSNKVKKKLGDKQQRVERKVWKKGKFDSQGVRLLSKGRVQKDQGKQNGSKSKRKVKSLPKDASGRGR